MQRKALEKIEREDVETIIGIDECGLGSWAGPIVVAGVAVPKQWVHPEVVDSKTISHAKRLRVLEQIICPAVLHRCVFSQDAEMIDREGVENVRRRLTEGVALFLLHRFPISLVVLDGDTPVPIYRAEKKTVCLPGADALVPAVSAASILGKVSRDLYMLEQAKLYPEYGFEASMGYGTHRHRKALEEHGLCPLHRLSYKPVREIERVRQWLKDNPPNPFRPTLGELVDLSGGE